MVAVFYLLMKQPLIFKFAVSTLLNNQYAQNNYCYYCNAFARCCIL